MRRSKIANGTTDAKIINAGTPSVNYDGENLKVAAGKAAYDNKNVGKGKAVMFTGFALEGDAAANYKLTARPDACNCRYARPRRCKYRRYGG